MWVDWHSGHCIEINYMIDYLISDRSLQKSYFNLPTPKIVPIAICKLTPLLSLSEVNPYGKQIAAVFRVQLLLFIKKRAIVLTIKVLGFRNDKSFRSLTKEG
jgi:hypothetical protein